MIEIKPIGGLVLTIGQCKVRVNDEKYAFVEINGEFEFISRKKDTGLKIEIENTEEIVLRFKTKTVYVEDGEFRVTVNDNKDD